VARLQWVGALATATQTTPYRFEKKKTKQNKKTVTFEDIAYLLVITTTVIMTLDL
jgi:hypothetical protein